MRVWRLTSSAHAAAAFDGEGAARYSGRWNSRGVRMAYTADSLALATLELAVHLAGARVGYVAIQVEIDDSLVEDLDVGRLRRTWRGDESITQRVGDAWVAGASSLALRVPSSLVDPRSGERNVLINPARIAAAEIVERQRFVVEIDERL